MAATLTVANSSIVITVEGLYPSGVQLTGYAADNVFEAGEVVNKETVMGVDGRLSAGFVYNEIPFTMTLAADSESVRVFEEIYQFESTNRTALNIGMSVALPSLGKRYVMKTGFMTSYKAPSAQRIMQPAVVQLRFARQEFSRT